MTPPSSTSSYDANLYKCPHCGALKVLRLAYGYDFGRAVHWSDTKKYYPQIQKPFYVHSKLTPNNSWCNFHFMDYCTHYFLGYKLTKILINHYSHYIIIQIKINLLRKLRTVKKLLSQRSRMK